MRRRLIVAALLFLTALQGPLVAYAEALAPLGDHASHSQSAAGALCLTTDSGCKDCCSSAARGCSCICILAPGAMMPFPRVSFAARAERSAAPFASDAPFAGRLSTQ